MREIEDDAVVLRTYKSGESDRVVVLWTREHGKVRVIAKGIRKTTSRLGGTLEALDADLRLRALHPPDGLIRARPLLVALERELLGLRQLRLLPSLHALNLPAQRFSDSRGHYS